MVNKKELTVIVTTPEGKVYNHTSCALTAQAVDGGLTILPNHAPIMVPLKISALKSKRVDDQSDDPFDYIAIGGGIMEVRDNIITILANVAELADDIDVTRAERAKDNAESVLKNKKASKKDIDRARISLNKAINRISCSRHRH